MGWRVGDPPLKPLTDESLEEKLAHWRERGLTMTYTYGRENFHGPTVNERAKKQVEDAKAAGLSPEPVGNRWV